MTKQEFINKYQSIYEFDDDDFDDRVEILGNKETKISYDNLTIEFNENTCDIYKEFTYGDYDSLFAVREINKAQLTFMQMLGKAYGTPPELGFYDGMGCPFVDEYVGYFSVEYDSEKLEAILNSFESVYSKDSFEKLDIEYISNFFPQEYSEYLEYETDINFAFRILLEPGFISAAMKYPIYFEKNDKVYIDKQGTLIIGFGDDTLQKSANLINIHMYKSTQTYIGLNYCFLRGAKFSLCIDSNYIVRIKKFLDIVKIEDAASIEYGLNKNGALIKTPFNEFWAIALPLSAVIKISMFLKSEILCMVYIAI